MGRPLLPVIILLFCFHFSFSQKPYFQQEVNYKIDVKLDDVKHTLSAFEHITYKNNSPDTLNELYFHLWPNAYKNNNTAFGKQQLENGDAKFFFALDVYRGYIDSLDFQYNNKSLEWNYDAVNKDYCIIKLAQALFPGQSIEITTPFHVKIPDAGFSRLGHKGQFYAITQWYPKPAVYDQYGWHPMPYLDQGEFYSEYGSFEVSITLPENYVLAATGEMVNADKEIEWLNSKAAEIIPVSNDDEEKDLKFPASSQNYKTITFKQDRIHDFAFFADKRYHVRNSEVTLASGKKVATWAYFTNNELQHWLHATDFINEAVRNYSEWVGEYPYSSASAVDGTISAGGGMEYPMITIIGEVGEDVRTLETYIAHEVGHNWFYGILGSNERDHPWMDEGINSYYETRSLLRSHPVQEDGNYNDIVSGGFASKLFDAGKIDAMHCTHLTYQFASSGNTDQPMSLKGPDYTNINYGLIIYRKSTAAFYYLENYLGTALLDSCMHAYFETWKFRHPYPSDIKAAFENTSGKDLSWFFDDLIHTTKKQDVKLLSLKNNNETASVKIRTKNELQWPFPVSTLKKDSVLNTTWINPVKATSVYNIPCNGCDKVIIDKSEVTLDVNMLNNNSKTTGIWKKLDPVKLKLIAGIPYKPSQKIFFSPALGWNNYNKLMAGILLHNKFLPQRKFEYSFIPMYGFNDKEIAGLAHTDYHFLPESHIFRDIILSADVKRFAYDERGFRNADLINENSHFHYLRLSPSLRFDIRNQNARATERHAVEFSSVHLLMEDVKYSRNQLDQAYGKIEEEKSAFYRIKYSITNTRVLDPYSFALRFEGGEGLAKTDVTMKYRFSYGKKGRGVDLRFFAGKVWENTSDGRYNYTLSDRSTAGGNTDYAFDDFYFGRSETEDILSKQMALRDGAFKSRNPLGSFREALLCLNIEVDFPARIPLRFFADIATFNDIKDNLEALYGLDNSFTADAGICLSLGKEAVAVYFPFFRSKDIMKYEDTNDYKFVDQIRFVFDIKKLNPLNIRKQVIQ